MSTHDDSRPDPDALLEQIQDEEARAQRGRLKIFFGASAGVGKTYTMLGAAQTAQAEGTALLVGLIETHGRAETQAMLGNLPLLPLKDMPYRDRILQEFDIDAALAFGAQHKNALILLDELAHSNVPGSRHPKRWQDVEELLDAGIDVWSTMNVQHLESLNDIVSGITGIRVWETVPDRLFDGADEVVVVDLPPDELLERLKSGKVYLPHQAERAAANFFRKGNLLALRELTLRRTADRIDEEMQAYRRKNAVQPVWANREALLACIGPGKYSEKIVRTCARLATQLNVTWHAIHVETPDIHRMPEIRRQDPLRILKLAQNLGATTATPSAPDAASALVRYAREHNLSRLVIGRSPRLWPWQHALADRIAGQADDLDVLQVALPANRLSLFRHLQKKAETQRSPWQGYIIAFIACSLTALLATPLLTILELTNVIMLMLLVVVGIALRYGRGPAVFAAFFGVALSDFFFVSPRFSFAVSDVQYLLTFAVMLVVALVVGQLTAGLQVQAKAATQREHRVRSLYEMSRDLSAALLPEQVAEIGARFLANEFSAKSALLAVDNAGYLQVLNGATAKVDMGVAQWSFDRGEVAGLGTDTLPASACLVLPLKAPMRLRGVLAIEPEPGYSLLLGPDLRRLLDTCASLLAISLERIHYVDVAQKSTVQIETERLRNSLLAAISHDLRTPLASLIGLADTLHLTTPALNKQQSEITLSIRQSALHMNALVNNLLDMARLQSGSIKLNQAWQPLEEVLGSAISECTLSLTGHPLKIKLADNMPLLDLDAVLMGRVFVNLLENAAKFTPNGSDITISAHTQNEHAVITVDDNGHGLPKGREQTIFEKFERGSKESTTPGVGLGLAICRAIVTTHGGTIHGETLINGETITGARFTILLPLGTPPMDDGSDMPVSSL